jgi:hypothetical protein
MSIELPTAIAAYIAGSNAHDAAACAACFTDDAVVREVDLRYTFTLAGEKIARLEIRP